MSYNKIIEELIEENEQLKLTLQNSYKKNHWAIDKITKLKKQNEKLYKPHEVFKFKEQIERLRIHKYKYIELYKQKYDENTRLQNELFSEHLKQVETEDFIDKLKQELKEYRGF